MTFLGIFEHFESAAGLTQLKTLPIGNVWSEIQPAG
jgi:hypothetical protein